MASSAQVVGEYLGSAAGVGYLILQSEGAFDIDAVLAGIAVLTAFALVLDRIVSALERRFRRWARWKAARGRAEPDLWSWVGDDGGPALPLARAGNVWILATDLSHSSDADQLDDGGPPASMLGHLAVEPGFGDHPLALDGGQRDAQRLRGLLDTQPGEVSLVGPGLAQVEPLGVTCPRFPSS